MPCAEPVPAALPVPAMSGPHSPRRCRRRRRRRRRSTGPLPPLLHTRSDRRGCPTWRRCCHPCLVRRTPPACLRQAPRQRRHPPPPRRRRRRATPARPRKRKRRCRQRSASLSEKSTAWKRTPCPCLPQLLRPLLCPPLCRGPADGARRRCALCRPRAPQLPARTF